ncbi:hypothetical protein LZ30DRAFT_808914 [Colletotrichum cereale]|nr:hypothetical protein LZ30DRAFT_808914 [Colletotrichum cereale]
MAIDPEKQTRYWRDRSPYPRPSAGGTKDGSDEDNTKESNNSSNHEAHQVKTLMSLAETQTPRRHRVTGWAPLSTQEQDLEPPLKRSITWDHEYAPWNPDRPLDSQGSTQTNVSLTTSPSDDFYWLSLSEGSYPDELLDPRSPRFDNGQPKPTAADHPHPSLHNAGDDSARTCFSLVNRPKGPHLSTKTSRDREPLNIEYLLGPRRSRVLPSPFPAPPRSDTDKPRGACVDADIAPLMEVAEKRAESMDCLAVWLVFGLVGVWVLLMVANLKLAGWEATLESMH